VATLVSGESGKDARRREPGNAGRSRAGSQRRSEHRPQQKSKYEPQNGGPQQSPARISQPRPPQKPHDPIFSKPYEPGIAPAAPKPEETATAQAKRRERPVAALLGGLKRA